MPATRWRRGGKIHTKKIFFGWWILLSTSLIHFWGAGTFFYSFTAFFNPIVDEFGWSYAAVSFAASIRGIEGGIASPIIGFAADRYGPRRLLFLGSVFSGLGFIFLSRIDSLGSFYLLFILLSVGASLLVPVPGWTAVTNWFVRGRSTALGILSAAIGAGGGLIYFSNWLIDTYGWRQALVVIGIGTWLIGIPASLVVRHRPEPYGLLPDGAGFSPKTETTGKTAKVKPEAGTGFTVRQALKHKAFWLIVVTVTISSGAVHTATVHIMPHLISVDFNRSQAGMIASLLVLVSILGRFGSGWLADRIDNRRLLVTSLLLQAAGLLMLSMARDIGQAVVFVLLFGPGYGSIITLRLILQAEYFGRRAFGSIQGIVMAFAIIGTTGFPFLTGIYFDAFGGYRSVWLTLAAMLLSCLPFAMALKPPRPTEAAPFSNR